MLSFDITDRNIRIIKGVESNGKIRISSAATLNLDEEVIINGHIKDVPRLATLINQVLKTNKMAEREAIISISSNLIIFKELYIPRVEKDSEFDRMVKSEMQSAMGIDDQYSISYIIVDDSYGSKSRDNEDGIKVLATACPYEIIEGYKKVFQMLNISLKSVMVGCNSITKVLLSDSRLKAKMPLLAVQIDNTFLSLNLYENGQLAFSRFATISPEDYDNSEDYVFEAVNENIFRMLQFQKSRNPEELIENVVFYGDTREYVRLTNALEQMDIATSIINVPPQIHGYENLEFSLYANAIGAMFKRNKDTERINLLETDTVNNNRIKSNSSYTALLLASCAIVVVIMGGIIGYLAISNNNIKKDTQRVIAEINSPKTKEKQARVVELQDMKTKVKDYENRVENAYDAYKTNPIIEKALYDKMDAKLSEAAAELNLEATILTISYDNGFLVVDIEAQANEDPSQALPSVIVDKMTAIEEFEQVHYLGYDISGSSKDGASEGDKEITMSLEIKLKAGEIKIEEPTTTADGEDGTQE